MSREMTRPTEAFEHVAEEVIRPFFREVAHTLDSALTNKISQEQILLNIFSIFAIILYFNFARVAVSRLTGREYDTSFRASLVEQITQFSVKGLGVSEMEGVQ
jgi:alanine-alpha-ketoisovalerate/valine-pyruvate aminotransferase